MIVHSFCQFRFIRLGKCRGAARGAWAGLVAFGLVAGALPAHAAPLVLTGEAATYSDAQRTPYTLVTSSYSDEGEGELSVTKSGTYKLEARDGTSFATNANQALKIAVGGGKSYWIAYRRAMPETETPVNGVLIYWIKDGTTSAQLLDTTPGTPGGIEDAPLSLGRTFSDFAANLHITPTRKIGSSSIEVVVNMGKFEGNQPPTLKVSAPKLSGATNKEMTFAAEASDPDRDTLAYAWDFNDEETGGGLAAAGANISHNWEKSADYRVRCTVSDMKGGTASQSLVIRVERLPGREDMSGRHRVSGTVMMGEMPFADALVRIEIVRDLVRKPIVGTAYTDSDGTFTLLNLLPGNYVVKVTRPGYAIEPIRISTRRTPENILIDRNDVTEVPFAVTKN